MWQKTEVSTLSRIFTDKNENNGLRIMNCRRFAFIIKHYFQIFKLFFLYCIKPNSCQNYDNYKINYLWKF